MISRRSFIHTTATAGVAAVAGADIAAAAPSGVSALIEAHRKAYAALNAACVHEDELDHAFEMSLKENELFYPVTEPNGRRCRIEIGLGRENAEQSIFAATARALSLDRHNGGPLDAEAFSERVAHAVACEKANLAALDDADRQYQARKDAFGLTAAEAKREELGEVADVALDALLSYQPATLAESEERMAYLVQSDAVGFLRHMHEEIQTLFASMTGGLV